MRPIGLGLLVALIVAMVAPAAAMAAPAVKAPTVDAASRKQGMADAPAILQAAGIECPVSDARLAGKGAKDPKTGVTPSVYEVACGPGSIGFLLQTNGTAAPNVFSCLVANYPADMTKPGNPCILPTNLDLMPAVTTLTTKAKVPCTPEKVRGIGQTATNTIFEVLCPGGAGYMVTASAPLLVSKDASALNCLAYDAANANVKCALGEPAARLAIADKFAGAANVGCTVKDRRFIGLLTDGTEGYEFACADGKGWIVKASTTGQVTQSLDCAKVPPGTCTLTDTRAATAEQASLYTKLAKNAGSNCAVTRYAIFPAQGDKEVVELVCADGAGSIGIFPASGKGVVYDCGHALLAGFRCTLGKVDYAGLTADLKKFDKKDCTVSSVGQPLKSATGSMRLEVACADGLPGYMVEYTDPATPKEAVACSFAGNCTLPTNKKKG
ncbi:MAG TPA: hypothetical protein VNW53_17345 [Phenylobacterium sp.]|jgi:hypothetical protein|uniref:hypothetical protein n=1 Tax=Phenylobacterium sp. TaxID=1871053 RepID=UPI002C915CDA|nr:hypothetical protein [Phenylobacterium sp.]HXA40768.1 hypothetical protein [Phenylobacterium sp.]